MKLQKIMMTAALAAACVAALAAAPQSDKQPVKSSTGRFGDASGVAPQYQDYLFGIIKEVNQNEVILAKTKFGVDQAFKFNKKTKFTLDGKTSTFDKLKVGEGIYIDVDTDKKTGEPIAKKVISGVDMPSIPAEK
jgi:opacity protein-like surface antigen